MTELIRIDQIKIGNRHRKDMGDIDELAASINQLGLLHAIGITPQKTLVFGQRRLLACKSLGWEEIEAKIIDIPAIIDGEMAENDIRKSFTPTERYTIFVDMQKRIGDRQGQRTDKLPENLPEVPQGRETRAYAAEKAGFGNETTARQVRYVVENGTEKLKDALDKELVSIDGAAKLAAEEEAVQNAVVAIIADENNKAKTVNAGLREYRKQNPARTPPLPKGKFNIIYADPPWKYGDERTELDSYGPAERHYQTMSIEDICALSIKERTAKDAALFLWVTSPLLAECWPVIEAWGFKYKASYIWDKQKSFVGNYNQVQHEILLVCTKGNFVPVTRQVPKSIISIERTKTHSQKPDLYPDAKRLELFSRNKRKGWTMWGNEVPND